MKTALITFALLSMFLIRAGDSVAAFVQYRDENGKVHYVNTKYSKVPDRYLWQIQDQLRNTEDQKRAATSQNIPLENMPQSLESNDEQPIDIKTRFLNLQTLIAELQSKNLLPASTNINSGIFNYMNKQNQRVFITPENIEQIPPEYYPQVNAQISNFEIYLKNLRNQKPLIKGTPVEVYTRQNCIDCTRLQTLLQANKIQFIKYDVDHSLEGKEFYKSLKSKDLPVTRIGDAIIKGIDLYSIKKALEPQIPDNTNLNLTGKN